MVSRDSGSLPPGRGGLGRGGRDTGDGLTFAPDRPSMRPQSNERPAMIRPRLARARARALAAPATLALLTLGVASGAFADGLGDLALIAQAANMPRGPGLYLNLFKFVPILLIYLMWVWTTGWIDDDTKELAKLSAEERQACEKLWADVAALVKKVGQETK